MIDRHVCICEFDAIMNDLVEQPAPVWLDGLNAAQSEAVTTLDGPLLVLSGAGTGKVTFKTQNITNLCPAPAIDRLVIIANTAQIIALSS